MQTFPTQGHTCQLVFLAAESLFAAPLENLYSAASSFGEPSPRLPLTPPRQRLTPSMDEECQPRELRFQCERFRQLRHPDLTASNRVTQSINVNAGPTAPWFGQPGLGTQCELPSNVEELIRLGMLERVQ